MIAIVNVGPHDSDPMGVRTYEVRINSKVITTFEHKRSEGLAACLQSAAKAVETRPDDAMMIEMRELFAATTNLRIMNKNKLEKYTRDTLKIHGWCYTIGGTLGLIILLILCVTSEHI